jgi:hypothetical protein
MNLKKGITHSVRVSWLAEGLVALIFQVRVSSPIPGSDRCLWPDSSHLLYILPILQLTSALKMEAAGSSRHRFHLIEAFNLDGQELWELKITSNDLSSSEKEEVSWKAK